MDGFFGASTRVRAQSTQMKRMGVKLKVKREADDLKIASPLGIVSFYYFFLLFNQARAMHARAGKPGTALGDELD